MSIARAQIGGFPIAIWLKWSVWIAAFRVGFVIVESVHRFKFTSLTLVVIATSIPIALIASVVLSGVISLILWRVFSKDPGSRLWGADESVRFGIGIGLGLGFLAGLFANG